MVDPVFPKVRCAAFITLLVILFLIYNYTYSEYLWLKSREVIMNLQSEHDADSFYVTFFKLFSHYTEDGHYMVFCMFLSPFICRERFWYYVVAI